MPHERTHYARVVYFSCLSLPLLHHTFWTFATRERRGLYLFYISHRWQIQTHKCDPMVFTDHASHLTLLSLTPWRGGVATFRCKWVPQPQQGTEAHVNLKHRTEHDPGQPNHLHKPRPPGPCQKQRVPTSVMFVPMFFKNSCCCLGM